MDRTGRDGVGTDNKSRSLVGQSIRGADGRLERRAAEMGVLFSALDKDKNGYVDKAELRLTMAEVGLELSEKDLDIMMKSAGVCIKDRIFYEDFVRMMTGSIGQSHKELLNQNQGKRPSNGAVFEGGKEEDDDIQELRIAFAMFDRDGDGLISEQEVQDTMTSLGFKVTLKEVKRIVKKVDPECNGMFNFEKFLLAMRRYQVGRDSTVDTGKEEISRCSGLNCGAECGGGGDRSSSQEPQKLDLVTAAFHVFDKDRDGFLNAQDLRVTMQQLGLVLSEEDVHAMMKSVGIGPQGKISQADFCRIYKTKTAQNAERRPSRKSRERTVTKRNEEEVRAVFSIFDQDQDGYISMNEVFDVLVSMGIHPSRECITEVFHQVDLDGNGKIDFREFLLLIKKYERPLPENVEMREMFNTLDKDRNGIVEAEELKASFSELGIPLTDADVKAMMKEANVQGDKICYEDFVRIMECQMNYMQNYEAAAPEHQVKNHKAAAERRDKGKKSATVTPERKDSVRRSRASLSVGSDVREGGVEVRRKSSAKSPSRSHSSGKGDKSFLSGSKRGSIKSSSSASRHSAQCDNVPVVAKRSSRDERDVIRPVSGDLDRAIYASLETTAKSEERRERLKNKYDRNSEEVREFFKESIVTGPVVTGSVVTGSVVTGPVVTGPVVTGTVVSGKVVAGPIVTKPIATEPIVTKQVVIKPVVAAPIVTGSVVIGSLVSKSSSIDDQTPIPSKVATKRAPGTWIAFKVFDQNCDGYISKVELHKTMNDLGIVLSEEDLDMMMKEADINKDGRIDYSEFSKLMNGSFEAYGNQAAEIQEQRKLSIHPTSQSNGTAHRPHTPTLTTLTPSNGHNSIPSPNQHSPANYRSNSPPHPPSSLSDGQTDSDLDEPLYQSTNTENSMRQAFKAFDLDGDGLIDRVELRKTMKRLGESLSDDDVNAMIRVVDRNYDGKVDYEEFLQLMQFTA